MNALLLCASLLATANPPPPTLYKSGAPVFDAALSAPYPTTAVEYRSAPSGGLRYLSSVVRSQTPGYEEDPALQTFQPNGAQTTQVPPASAAPYTYDPFLGGAPPADPNAGYLPSAGLPYGNIGPQPYRLGGWTSRYDAAWISRSGTEPNVGTFSVFETNAAWRYSTGWPYSLPSWIFSLTPEFNYRSWNGPADVDFPGSVYRFATDFELATPAQNPVSFQLGFTPQIVSDLQQNLNADAYQWDGRGVMFVRVNPEVMLAGGIVYWDRVNDQILPYAGVIWTPNPCWEFRLLFPKSRISWFMGDWGGTSAWLYTGVEYVKESYATELAGPFGQNEKIELVDYRWTVGLRTERMGVSSFIEAGWVFAREANFKYGTPDFDINDGFLIRGGLRF